MPSNNSKMDPKKKDLKNHKLFKIRSTLLGNMKVKEYSIETPLIKSTCYHHDQLT
jgi:hypothetical protein